MICDVIIPCGPGHEEIHQEAVNSVRIASLNKGVFDTINIRVVDDTKGELGRSKARNLGVAESEADWIFFLDADDLMHPEAFEVHSHYPYIDALWGNIWEMREGICAWRYQIPTIKSYKDFIHLPPYYTLQMGHFVKREVAVAHPFDEKMDCGEDFKYYIDVWKEHTCIKVKDCLFLNRKGMHATGPRSATGGQWNQAVNSILEEERNPLRFKEKLGYKFPSKDSHFTESTFELDHLVPCLEECTQKRVALDIGAHVGAWSKELKKHFTDVYSFEADKDNYQCLINNSPYSINRHLAIGNTNKRVSIGGADRGNTGNGHVIDGNDVKMIRIDGLALNDVDFIKIDVEGMEPDVLRGAEKTIKKYHPVILIEQTPGTDMRYGESYLKGGEILEEWGYKLHSQMNKNYLYV